MENEEKFLGETETIIVGGGQAGLSVGRYLKDYQKPFLILEKGDRIGESWENRYDSLVLDSFAKYSHLEDFPFSGDQMRQPKGDEVVEYLRNFARHFDLRPKFSTEVLSIEKPKDKFIIKTSQGVFQSSFLVLATGPFDKPYTPLEAKNIPKDILQIHSHDYKNPASLKPGAILVVGRGNSGSEIAEELIKSGRQVYFSFKGKFRSVRSSHLSQWLAYRLGLAHVPKDSLLGKIIVWYTKGNAVGVNVKYLLNHPKITLVAEFKGEIPKDYRQGGASISNIVWATGYKNDFSIISIPDFDPNSQKRGVTSIPGLYILNIRWQYSKSSSHLAGVSRDAKYIVKDIMKRYGR